MLVKVIKKAICYFGGMFLIAFGIIFSTKSATGISPVSSIPRALEKIFLSFGIEGITLGMSTSIIYAALILLQVLILRRNFKLVQLLQFFTTFVLSFFIDFCGGILLKGLGTPTNYLVRLLFMGISIVLIGVGVGFYLIAKWLPLPAEGLSMAVSDASKGRLPFHNAKSIIDSLMVLIALILSFSFLGGVRAFTDPSIVVVREGTVLSAVLVGKVVGLFNKSGREKLLAWVNKDTSLATERAASK